LPQWRAYLARRAWLPAALSDLKLDGAPQWSVHTKRFTFTPPPKLLALDDKSLLTLTMGFFPEGTRTIWDVQEAWWNRDAQRKAMIGLWRRLRPPSTARLELRSAFDDMRARRDPYNGQFSRDSTTTSQLSIMVDVPGEKAGLISVDVLYGVTLRTDFAQARELGSPLQFMPQLASAARILETGPGESIVPAQPSPAAPVDPFEDATASMLKLAEQEDATKGRDLRGRLMSEDLRDTLAAARIRFGTPGADPQQLIKDMYQQTKMLWSYWAIVPALRHNREMWSTFLARNHRDLDTPHHPEVLAAEKALMEALQKGEPSEEWVTLARKLLAAYVQERSAEARTRPLSDADYHPRLSPCPAPATRTSGLSQVIVEKMSRTPDEFYPATSQRQADEGPVIVSMHVSDTGCAIDIAISSSSGSEQLDEAAQRYVETIEFLPAEKKGKPVSAVKQLRVMFKLADTEPSAE
ncbi:MAG TPA: energy transducer TonB, partial [Steroidobacteraceae bacterium]|nr:energy transducer TonB [Steroidobacteraceae bacterium]